MTALNITNGANDYGRARLRLTGRLQSGNDGWNMNGRNNILFAVNTNASGVGVGAVGTDKFAIQYELVDDKLGVLSSTGGTAPLMVFQQNGNVGIGTTSPQCLLHVNGSIAFGQATILTSQTSYTVGADDVTIIYNYYSLSVTLPNASSFTGRILNFVSDAGAATCSATSVANNVIPIFSTTAGNVICASNNYGWCTIQSDGTYWRQIARGN